MKKVITFILSVAIFFNISNLSVYAIRNPKTTSEQYVVEDITYDEYVELRAKFLNISSDKMKNEMLTTGKTNSNNTVYRKYTKTFSYKADSNFKTDLVCLFALTGKGDYFDITEAFAFTEKSRGCSSYCEWEETLTHVRSLTGSSATLYGTGKFVVRDPVSVSLPGISFPIISINDLGYWVSEPLDMVVDVTVDELKYCANIKNV